MKILKNSAKLPKYPDLILKNPVRLDRTEFKISVRSDSQNLKFIFLIYDRTPIYQQYT